MKKQQKTEIRQNTIKPSLFSGMIPFLRNLFMRNEPNLSSQKLTVTSCSTVVYNASQPNTKNGTNPNEPNFRNGKSPVFQKNLFMQFKANFKNQEITASTYKRETYPNLHPQTHPKSKANPNPMQTQSKANPNPISGICGFGHSNLDIRISYLPNKPLRTYSFSVRDVQPQP